MFLNATSFKQLKISENKFRRPDINAIFQNITRANAMNITVEDVKQQVDLLIASAKLKNMPTSQWLDSFYIIENFTTFDLRMSTRRQYR